MSVDSTETGFDPENCVSNLRQRNVNYPLNKSWLNHDLFNGRDRIRTNPTGEVETKKSAKGGTECAPLQNKITLIDELLSVFETLSPESQRELLHAALEQKQRESNNE